VPTRIQQLVEQPTETSLSVVADLTIALVSKNYDTVRNPASEPDGSAHVS
jgi:hypothetical protein